jgi:hypothetical protein
MTSTTPKQPVRLPITCVNKVKTNNIYEQISDVGVTVKGQTVILPLKDAIRAIEDKLYTFFVVVDGFEVDVEIDEREGHKYLRTKPDSTKKNNLLSLNSCTPPSLWG